MDRTAAEKNLSLRDPPQAENPASQDSILIIGIFCTWQMDTNLMMQGLWQNASISIDGDGKLISSMYIKLYMSF